MPSVAGIHSARISRCEGPHGPIPRHLRYLVEILRTPAAAVRQDVDSRDCQTKLRHDGSPDERAGVRVARAQGFSVTGTLGVLVEAAADPSSFLDEALGRLAKTRFRRSPDLFAQTRQLLRQVRS